MTFVARQPDIDGRVYDLLCGTGLDPVMFDGDTAYCAIGELASNTATPPHVLSKIFHDVQEPHLARWTLPGLAANRSTPPEILQSLADRGGDLTDGLASNPSAPLGFLERLARERPKEYGLALLENQALPEEALVKVVEGMKGDELFDEEIATSILAHENCSGRVWMR